MFTLVAKIIKGIKHIYIAKLGPFIRAIKTPLLPNNPDGKVLVHIGCGELDDLRYINIDARSMPHVHYATQDLGLKQFAPESVDLIYACHVIEHLSHQRLLPIFTNWFSRLKYGGVVRLSVPNFDTIVEIYKDQKKNIDAIKLPLLGGQEYDFNYHNAIFNYNYLCDLLKKSGFKTIREWDPKSASYYNFDDWASKTFVVGGKEYPISLNLEAVK